MSDAALEDRIDDTDSRPAIRAAAGGKGRRADGDPAGVVRRCRLALPAVRAIP